MRRAALIMLLVAACGTRAATYSYIGLAGISGALAINAKASACDGDHSECDRVGPQVAFAVFGLTAVGFALAALVSAAATPSPKPAAPVTPR
jgi:hypothetical protein